MADDEQQPQDEEPEAVAVSLPPSDDVPELPPEAQDETVPESVTETQRQQPADAPDDVHGDNDGDSPDTVAAPERSPDGTDRPIVVDASDHVAGRLSSLVAKMLLQGNRVSLVNCERIMISGSRSNTIGEYRQFLKINSIINPKHGPVHYRRPDTVITKMVRGMLPFEKKPSGKKAHKRLRAYIGSPKELKSFKKVQFEKAKIRRPASSYTTMGELCEVIGWTK